MRRANNLLPLMAAHDNLALAFWKAGKGKRYAASVLAYQNKLDQHLTDLQKQIETGYVEVGNYRYFFVHEPKRREICAAAFSEQVLHHALMNVCDPYFERVQIYDSYATRRGKGTYAALDRASGYAHRYAWFLKLDVRKYFASIDHQILKTQLARLFKETRLLSMLYRIIDSYEASPGKGLPIGNLTSQYFANHYLSGLDHYTKEKLGVSAYVRYMDDMVLWSNDKAELLEAHRALQGYLAEQLRLELKPGVLNRTAAGAPFLGYQLYPYHSRLLQKSKVRFIRKLQRTQQQLATGYLDETQAQAKVLPLLAFVEHANTELFRKKVLLQLKGQVP